MKGTVRKRGSAWSYSFDVNVDPVTGKRKQKSKSGFKTKKECEKALRKAIDAFENGYIETPDKMTLDDCIKNWLEYIKEYRKLNTYNRYISIYNKHIKENLGMLKLDKLRAPHVEKFLLKKKKEGLSGSTLQLVFTILNSSLEKMVKQQMLMNNICRYVERPKRKKFKPDTLTIEDINTVLNCLDLNKYNDYLMFLAFNIVLELGIRRGELAGLEWDNIDFDEKIVHIENNLVYTNGHTILTTPKTEDSDRTITISDNLLDLLSKHKKIQIENKLFYGPHYERNFYNGKERNFIMTWERGKCVHPNYYTLRIKRIMKNMGIEKNIRFHDLRHSNATLLLQNGTDFRVMQERLGHADIKTTMNIYAHVNTDMQREATDKISKMLIKK